jgi:hypothetical protein
MFMPNGQRRMRGYRPQGAVVVFGADAVTPTLESTKILSLALEGDSYVCCCCNKNKGRVLLSAGGHLQAQMFCRVRRGWGPLNPVQVQGPAQGQFSRDRRG